MLGKVHWEPFDDCVLDRTSAASKVPRSQYLDAGAIPVVDQGQSFIAGYTNDRRAGYRGRLPVVIFGDHTRAIKLVDVPFAAGADGVKVLEPRAGLDAAYLHYFLRSLRLPNDGYSRHFKHLKMLRVPVPDLEAQRRVVLLLSRAENIVRMRREAEAKAREIIPALFLDMFGDPVANCRGFPVSPLASVSEVVSGVAKGRRLARGATREVGYLRVANVQAGHLNLETIKTIPATESEISELRLRRGDVLLTEGGDHDKLGRGAMLEADLGDCIHQNHVFRVRPDGDHLVPKYFDAYLQTNAARNYFLKSAKRTTNLASINMSQLKALPVLLPGLDRQRSFAAHAGNCGAVIEDQKSSTMLAVHAFDALMARVFEM